MSRSARRRRSSGSIAFFLLQGAVSGTSFLVWALGSHLLPAAEQVPAATALGWGMVLYLPLTLGLPYLLPNLHRGADPAALALSGRLLRALRTIAASAAGTAVVLAGLAAVAGTPTVALGLAVAVAGGNVLGIAGQQVARIERRLGLLAVATLTNLLLPAGWLAAALATGSPSWSAVLLSAGFLAYSVLAGRAIGGADRVRLRTLLPILRRSAPLVPHLLAFGLLAQGIRFTSGLSATPAVLLQAHFVMTFLGMGMTVLSAVQSIVSVDVQVASAEGLPRASRRSLAVLTASGAITGAVVVGVYASPLRGLFAGAAAPDGLLLVALALPLPLQGVYFALNNLYLRAERTVELAAASCTTAVLFVAAEVLLRPPSVTLSLLLYDLVLTLLPALLAVRLRGTARRPAPVPVAAATAS